MAKPSRRGRILQSVVVLGNARLRIRAGSSLRRIDATFVQRLLAVDREGMRPLASRLGYGSNPGHG